jgi:hypothetical protein
MAKSTEIEVARRVDELYPLVLEGLSLREIRAYAAGKTAWGGQISDAQLKRYIAAARRQIKQAAAYDRAEEIGAAKLRLERVYARASAKGELRNVLAAIKLQMQLLGLAEPSRSEVSLNLEDIEREIARVEDQIAANEARKQR